MFSADGFRDRLAKRGKWILNVLRVINIVALADIVAACIIMLFKIDMLNSFFVFEAITHAVVIIVSIFLIFTESPFFQDYFDRHWPMFGQKSSFYSLGGIMLVLGISILGNLNNKVMTAKEIGTVYWQIIASAGFVAIVVAALNVIASFVFTYPKSGTSARIVRSEGAVESNRVNKDVANRTSNADTPQNSSSANGSDRSITPSNPPDGGSQAANFLALLAHAAAWGSDSNQQVNKPEPAHHPPMEMRAGPRIMGKPSVPTINHERPPVDTELG